MDISQCEKGGVFFTQDHKSSVFSHWGNREYSVRLYINIQQLRIIPLWTPGKSRERNLIAKWRSGWWLSMTIMNRRAILRGSWPALISTSYNFDIIPKRHTSQWYFHAFNQNMTALETFKTSHISQCKRMIKISNINQNIKANINLQKLNA